MYKNPTTPLLVNFYEPERLKLDEGQSAAREAIGRKPSRALIIKATLDMVFDDDKLRRRLFRELKSRMVSQ